MKSLWGCGSIKETWLQSCWPGCSIRCNSVRESLENAGEVCWSLRRGNMCRCVAITRNYSGEPHNGVAGKSNRGQTNSRSEHLWAAVWVCAKEKHYRYCIWTEVVDRELRRSEGAALHFGTQTTGSWGRNVVQGWETLLGGRVFKVDQESALNSFLLLCWLIGR